MLMPKKVKHRKHQRGRTRGQSKGGNKVSQGEFGIQALEPAWLTARQIEAARIAMTRHIKRGGKVWINVFPDKPITQKRPKLAWVLARATPRCGSPLSSQVESCLSSRTTTKQWLVPPSIVPFKNSR